MQPAHAQTPQGYADRTWNSRGLVLNQDLFRAEFNGIKLDLTAREYDLLATLHRERHRVVPRDELHRRIWSGSETGERVVDTYVSRLRTKLRACGHPGIGVLRKRGYRLLGSEHD